MTMIGKQPGALEQLLTWAIFQPFHSYWACKVCSQTWWDREDHRYDCPVPILSSSLPTEEEDGLLKEVGKELSRAQVKHASMSTPHHGYAVILEELDELWDEVTAQTQDKTKMRKEALQVSAMGLRFIKDVCDAPGDAK